MGTWEQKSDVSILIIDDEPFMQRALTYLLSKEGYCVETASNGEEGLARVCELKPALVILDIMMPHMNGYEVCERIRQEPALMHTRVVMLSARGQQIDRERGLLAGADEYITKPFSPRQMVECVRAMLSEPYHQSG